MLLVAGQSWAGVVEDAEEELKKLGRGQQHLVVSGAGRHAAGYQTKRASSRTRRSRSATSQKRGERAQKADTAGASVATGKTEPDTEVLRGRVKKDRETKHKGRLVSFGVILFFALLVFLATVASKRLGSSE